MIHSLHQVDTMCGQCSPLTGTRCCHSGSLHGKCSFRFLPFFINVKTLLGFLVISENRYQSGLLEKQSGVKQTFQRYSIPVQQTMWLKQQKFIFSGFWKLEGQIKVLVGLNSSEDSLLGLQRAALSLSSHGLSSVCTPPGVSLYASPKTIILRD